MELQCVSGMGLSHSGLFIPILSSLGHPPPDHNPSQCCSPTDHSLPYKVFWSKRDLGNLHRRMWPHKETPACVGSLQNRDSLFWPLLISTPGPWLLFCTASLFHQSLETFLSRFRALLYPTSLVSHFLIVHIPKSQSLWIVVSSACGGSGAAGVRGIKPDLPGVCHSESSDLGHVMLNKTKSHIRGISSWPLLCAASLLLLDGLCQCPPGSRKRLQRISV